MANSSPASCAHTGLLLSLALALATLLLAGAVEGQAIEEYQLKAAVLYNLAKFVDWPPNTFRSAADPIVTCILGDSPFGRSLERELDGKSIEDRRFAVRRVAEAGHAAGCQILIVTASDRKRWRSALAEIKAVGILTVGETEGFASDGGVANLKLESGKVRIQISVKAAEHEGLRISSRLLSLAQIVDK